MINLSKGPVIGYKYLIHDKYILILVAKRGHLKAVLFTFLPFFLCHFTDEASPSSLIQEVSFPSLLRA